MPANLTYTENLSVISERLARLEVKMETLPEIKTAMGVRLDRLDLRVEELPEIKAISSLHLARLEQSFTDLSDIKATISKVSDKIAALPCKVHEGDVKVLETKVGNNSKLTWTNLALLLGLGGKLIYDWITRAIS